MKTAAILFLSASLASSACSKKDDGGSGDTPAAKGGDKAGGDKAGGDPVVKPKAGGATPFEGFDPAAMQEKLQGAWFVKDVGYLGALEAWEVKGDKVTTYDAKDKKEETATLTVDSPCSLTTTVKAADGSSSGSTETYYFDGADLHIGLGSAGMKKGDTVTACVGNGVYVMKASDCGFYTRMFEKWDKETATCAMTGDKLAVSEKSFGGQGELTAKGDLLIDEQLSHHSAVKAKDFADAKAQADAAVGGAK